MIWADMGSNGYDTENLIYALSHLIADEKAILEDLSTEGMKPSRFLARCPWWLRFAINGITNDIVIPTGDGVGLFMMLFPLLSRMNHACCGGTGGRAANVWWCMNE